MDLSNEWDKEKLRNWMANAKRLGREDVYQAAFRQLCRAEGRNIDHPLEAEFAAVMRALEEAMTEESGRTKRLSRTRQKLSRVGVRKTLADLALKPQPSLGFMKLLEFNMADMSAEALILKHRNEFDHGVVEAAESRLSEYDVRGLSRCPGLLYLAFLGCCDQQRHHRRPEVRSAMGQGVSNLMHTQRPSKIPPGPSWQSPGTTG